MSVTVAELKILMNASGNAKGELRETAQEINKTGDAAQRAEGKSGGFFGGILGFGAKAGLAITGIGGIGMALGGLVGPFIEGNAQFETYNTQFGVMLGSADAAKARLGELAEFGAKTPFELPQIVEADKVLQGFGLHSEEAAKKFGFSGKEIRTIAGDVASGTGASFEEMSLLLGKFSSGATGEAISRMQEMGITTREELTKMGLEFDKSGALLSPLPESMNVVLGLMKDKYGGMMDAQSSTFSGMVSNLQDWIGATTRAVGAPIFDKVKEGLGGVLQWINSPEVQAGISQFSVILTEGIGRGVEFITQAINVAWPIIEPFFQNFVGLITTIAQGGDPFAAFGTYIGNLWGLLSDLGGKLLGWLGEQLPGWMEKLGEFTGALVTKLGEALPGWMQKLGEWGGIALQAIGEMLPPLIEKLGEWAAAFIAWISPMIPPFLAALGQMLGEMLGWIFGTALPAIVDKLGEWGKAFIDWIGPRIPPMLAKLAELAGQLISWLWNTALPAIVQKLGEWGKAFIDWIGPRIGPLLVELGKIGLAIGTWILTEALPAIISKLVEWGGAFIGWVAKDVLPKLPGVLANIASGVWTFITETALPTIISKLVEWGSAFLNWVTKDVIPSLPGKLGEIWTKISGWITSTGTSLATEVAKWTAKFLSWIGGAVTQLPGKLGEIWTEFVGWANRTAQNILEAVKDIGANIVQGIWNGVQGAWQGFMNWLQEQINKIPEPIRKAMGIGSPSKVMADIFQWLPPGMQEGVERTLGGFISFLTDVGRQLEDKGRENAARYNAAYLSNIAGLHPVWTPDRGGQPEYWNGTPTGGSGGRTTQTWALATGGIAMRPINAVIAEKEPEAVIPLSRLPQVAAGSVGAIGGGRNVNIESLTVMVDPVLHDMLVNLERHRNGRDGGIELRSRF